ncbi:MAG: hypothetical protein IKI65_01660, partial [Firmicutes bacterium]|nr:hypothetical protein [Bacillota bacterium]
DLLALFFLGFFCHLRTLRFFCELVDFRAVREAGGSIRTEKKTLSDLGPEDRPFYTGKRRIL